MAVGRIDFLENYHSSTPRDYLARVNNDDKPYCSTIAKKWGYDYWDGDRKYGYGGNHYDGRWRPIAEKMAAHYDLKAGDKILDVGCGKGFLLYEFTQVVPGVEIAGIDISKYAIEHSHPSVRPFIKQHDCVEYAYSEEFDFVYSINTLHNLGITDLMVAIPLIESYRKRHAWICVESYRTEKEKVNLLYWQLTCESFHRPQGWASLYKACGYHGDYGFVFFT